MEKENQSINGDSSDLYEIAYPEASKFMENIILDNNRISKLINKLNADEWETLRDSFADFFVITTLHYIANN